MLQRLRHTGWRSLLASALFMSGASGAFAGPCSVSKASVRGDFGELRFKVEIADTNEERAQGLMHRASLPRMSGMLFVYERPQPVSFWMKNTLIPLDMLFLNERGEVVHIHENAIPGDLTAIPGGDDIFAVLEINGGLSQDFGIQVGAQMQHKSFPQNLAIWPC